MTEYTATARREDRWWIVQCDQHPGAISQVSRLDQAEEVHREAIAFVADVPIESVSVTVHPEVDREASEELAEALQLRTEAAEAERKATDLKISAAQRLKRRGLTVRDIGAVLGVNHQYAAKLASGKVRESANAKSYRTFRERGSRSSSRTPKKSEADA